MDVHTLLLSGHVAAALALGVAYWWVSAARSEAESARRVKDMLADVDRMRRDIVGLEHELQRLRFDTHVLKNEAREPSNSPPELPPVTETPNDYRGMHGENKVAPIAPTPNVNWRKS